MQPSRRAASPADSNTSVLSGAKRKERDFDHDEGEETNIHVVVRCRGRSDREVKENSGVVVSTSGVKGTNVDLSMGPNAISNKTYHFDKVFSPAADQTIVFEDTVAPILSEMMAGFNCTIFAYGQTGTGKTYTMTGDMTDTLGLLSDEAGIIPRTLYSLFRRLEAEEIECSVKCSFIELYNEELRDLLSADDSVKLKIYDDANKKSHSATIVQGMEESHIKSASAGIKLLQKGSYRRQVAATKCNDLSSRSHTVFTITTYIKKVNEVGEDFICSGKLNLVDLAGSENIQRSGAENKRAAEAGLINKSLLTLGRVINALVDKSSHIPYRESKLTRLLQDSLGGRTKTCIIATVSPAKSNLEETISTLDYAFRAKNIRNKPQINSMISKKTLLKEFTAEIEKLKSELIATRQRNGVYLSNEQYEDITVESESRRILSEEQKARIETMETSLRNKVQELYNLTESFTHLKRDNETTKSILNSTKDVLFKTEAVVSNTKENLEDETALRKAHQETEGRLKSVGNQLLSVVSRSVTDLDAVHSKLRRRSQLHNENRQLWQSSTESVTGMTSAIEDRLEVFQSEHQELVTKSTSRLQKFLDDERAKVEACKDMVSTKVADMQRTKSAVESQSASSKDDMHNVLEEIKVLRDEVKDRVGEGLKGLNNAAAKISGEVIEELEQFHTQLHTSYSSLGKDFKTLFEDMTTRLASQREENDRLRTALQEAHHRNIESQRAATAQLEASLEEERRASEQSRQTLKDQICGLIDASAVRQDERIASTLSRTQRSLGQASNTLELAEKEYAEGMNEWLQREQALLDKVTGSRDELKGRMKKDWTAIGAKNTAIQVSTKAVHGEAVKIVDAQIAEMTVQMSALDEFVTRARTQNEQSHQQHLDSMRQYHTEVTQLQSDVTSSIEQRTSGLQTYHAETIANTTSLSETVTTFSAEAEEALKTMRTHVQETSLTDYTPTGQTPQKRDWSYPKELPSTAPHTTVIARSRGLPDPIVPESKTPGRSPRKSPRKASPTKLTRSSPTKGKVYTDAADGELTRAISLENMTEPIGLKEINMNIVAGVEEGSKTISFSKSIGPGGGQAPVLKKAKITRSRTAAERGNRTVGVTGGEWLGRSYS
ncbi:Kinesin-like protein bimC [Cyphellophora attinorum]|uniref:Kinesin-like protein bimC n=1 Tax=Cyphellophora attinorum TaxID=1664694 RepID=A0A0N1HYD6_9EURO|nr:Kinesin-like protein bimC [Phialophora attinorum]KPI45827.1 Kinesin-like protein bimC [Phialophora attinorum]